MSEKGTDCFSLEGREKGTDCFSVLMTEDFNSAY